MECGMERRFHRGFTAAEKTELWDRWKRGESLKAIGRAFGKQSSSIYFLVAPHGGIRPAERRRSRLALTLAEREAISRGVTAVCTENLNPNVLMMKSAQDSVRTYHAGSLYRPRNRRIFVQRSMRSDAVVIIGVRFQNSAQMLLAEDNEVIQTLTPDRSDQPFGKAILPR